MTRQRFYLGALALLALGAFGPARADKPPVAKALPVPFQPRGVVELFRLRAEGSQIYECKAGKKAGSFEWALKGPQAELFDEHGNKAGTHGAGPTWEVGGSKVRARVAVVREAPDKHAIPWLLLKVTAHKGKGRFDKVKYIQRIDTWAGRAPAKGCDTAGKEARVKYQATYVFYGER